MLPELAALLSQVNGYRSQNKYYLKSSPTQTPLHHFDFRVANMVVVISRPWINSLFLFVATSHLSGRIAKSVYC